MYRLHIDLPLGTNLEEAIRLANIITNDLKCGMESGDAGRMGNKPSSGWEVGYRLGCDTDRQKSNYLDINENGHCSTRKNMLTI